MFTEFFRWILSLEFNGHVLHRWASELPGLEIVMFVWIVVILLGACGFAYVAHLLHADHDAKQRKLYPFDPAGGPDTEQDTVPSFKRTTDTAKRDTKENINKTFGKFGGASGAYYGHDAKGKAIAPEGDYICRGDYSVTRHTVRGVTDIRAGLTMATIGRLVTDDEITQFLSDGTIPHR